MPDSAVRVRRAGAGDVDALLTISSGLWAEDAGTHDPDVMNTDWPREHGRASFEALVDDPDRVGLLAEAGGELAGDDFASLDVQLDAVGLLNFSRGF